MNGNDCSVCRKTESDALFDKRSQKNVNDYSSELFSLKSKALKIRKSVCDLDDVIGMIQASTQLQDQKIESLEAFCQKTEEFIADTVRIDEEAAAVINQSKEDFYNQYNYLRPDAEKSDWEAFWDNAAEWCAEHWKEIVTTVTIIIGAALAIAAVVTTGGAALVPLLSTLLTAIGVSAGTAMTAATIISFTVAAIAVGSTIGSSALNIIDTWGNIDNPTFNTWQSVLNWTSIISNGLYSAGNIYNSVKYTSGRNYINLGKQKSGTVAGIKPDFYVGPNGKILPSQYKDWIGTNLQKKLLSQAENSQLQNAIKQLYRGSSFIGDGGTSDIIRFEQQTGLMLGKNGGSHVQKGIDMAKYIENKILTQNLSPSDRALATQLLEDLYRALGR